MNTREHPTADHDIDWRVAKSGHKPRMPKHLRKALRDYRRKVIPMAEVQHSKWWSRLAIGCACVIACAILWARSQGWMP